jgi:acyl-coenzyme A synthetase/AMP-(fatty) acid ligase
MIRASGMWVSPVEVEAALAEHAAVVEAGVVGAAGADGLVKPLAFVVLARGHEAGPALEAELKALVKERLAAHKCPRWILFVPELPKTATGKIQRFRLRQLAADGAHLGPVTGPAAAGTKAAGWVEEQPADRAGQPKTRGGG